MVVTIKQTASNTKQTYDILGDSLYMQGQTGRFHRQQNITLSGRSLNLYGRFHFGKWYNYIPFRYLFGKTSQTRHFEVFQNLQTVAHMVYSTDGFMKKRYLIQLGATEFACYPIARGPFQYVPIYHGDTQIALVETYLTVQNYLYTHKLYILPEYDAIGDKLIFFALYYANYAFDHRFHMSISYEKQYAYTISRYIDKLDIDWRKKHFPNVDFFGRCNLSD